MRENLRIRRDTFHTILPNIQVVRKNAVQPKFVVVWVSFFVSLLIRISLAVMAPLVPDEAMLIVDAKRIADEGLTLDRILFNDAGTFTIRGFIVPLLYSFALNSSSFLPMLRLMSVLITYVGIFFAYLLFRRMVSDDTARYVLCLMLLDPIGARWLSMYALTESFITAAVWAAAYALWRGHQDQSRCFIFASLILAAGCAFIRLPSILMLVFVVTWLLMSYSYDGLRRHDPRPFAVLCLVVGIVLLFLEPMVDLLDKNAPGLVSEYSVSVFMQNSWIYATTIVFRWNDLYLSGFMLSLAYAGLAAILFRALLSWRKPHVQFLILMISINISFFTIIEAYPYWVFRYLVPYVLYPFYLVTLKILTNPIANRNISFDSWIHWASRLKVPNEKQVTLFLAISLLLLTIPVGVPSAGKYAPQQQAASWLKQRSTNNIVLSNIGQFLQAYGCPQEIISLGTYDLLQRDAFFQVIVSHQVNVVILTPALSGFPERLQFLESLWSDFSYIVYAFRVFVFDDGESTVIGFQVQIHQISWID